MFENTLIRCSALGNLFIEPKTKAAKEAGELSETAKSKLIEVYVRERYGREKEISNKYFEKGNKVEEDSITLYSRLKKKFFKKNDTRIKNDFIAGTPDLFVGESIMGATHIIDIKSSWDLFTFTKVHLEPINRDYYYQLQGYMMLTGAQEARLAYCLVNTPEEMIAEEERRLFYRIGATTMEAPEYLEACAKLRKSMEFDDIPMQERLIEFVVERDEAAIEQIPAKVQKAREFLNHLAETITPSQFEKAA